MKDFFEEHKGEIVITIIVVVFVSGLLGLIFNRAHNDITMKQQCNESNGQYMHIHRQHLCFKSEIMIELEE